MPARGTQPGMDSRFCGNDIGGSEGWHNKMMKISPFNPSSPSLTAGPPSPHERGEDTSQPSLHESGERVVRKCGPGEGNMDTMEVIFLGGDL
jgi:hypothetical protein